MFGSVAYLSFCSFVSPASLHLVGMGCFSRGAHIPEPVSLPRGRLLLSLYCCIGSEKKRQQQSTAFKSNSPSVRDGR